LDGQIENIVLDDSVLVEKCRQGDSDATERLIIKYQDRIHNVIFKICQNRDDAAELTQETFVKLIEKIDTFKGNSAFYTWLFRIAINLTYTHCKRSVKLGMKSLDGTAEAEAAGAQLKDFLTDSTEADPTVLAQKKEVVQLIMAALGKLDEDHRAVIVLRDIEGMTYAEISETLEIGLGTVKSRLSRARANLKDILEVLL